ncbi:MAG: FAD-dependent monooxygenase [Alteromonadaceae bacterium]|nr:FAD-dependent monooxygenase [Alteromonadaceae bacterium]
MKVLIVGAGIAGLSMARLLKKQDVDYKIIEKKPSASTSGAGIALPFNALRALKEIGVYDAVMGHAHQVKQIRYTTSKGKLLGQADLTQAPFSDDKFVALKRHKLLSVLLEGLEDKVHYASELTSINNLATGVSVESTNAEVSGDYDLVIAAEGINSTLRTQQYSDRATLYSHKLTGWRFIIKSEKHQLQPTYMLGNTDLFMAYPLSEDELYCYAHIHEENSSYSLTGDAKKDLKNIFSSYAEPAKSIIQSIDNVEVITGELKSVTEAFFYKNRVVFVGDAANACSPLLQQGAAAAFEDALCLVEALAGGNIDKALEKYKQARKTRIEWIINYSDKPLASVKKMDNSIVRFIRNTLIRIMGPVNVYGWKKLATDPALANKINEK